MWIVWKKEFISFFHNMMGYLYAAFMILVAGIFFSAFNLQGGMAEFGYVLGNTLVVLLIVIPVLTMRAVGDERRQKTDQLLFTSPVPGYRIILGKFFAVLSLFLVPFVVLMLCPLILSQYGTVALAESYSCFAAFFLMGAACIAIGIFVSGLTESPVIAAVGTFSMMLLSYLIRSISGLIGTSSLYSLAGFVLVILLGALILAPLFGRIWPAAATALIGFGAVIVCYLTKPVLLEGAFPRFLESFNLFQRYYDFVDGIFDVTHVIYYLSVTILFLMFSILMLEARRTQKRTIPVIQGLLILVIMVFVNLLTGHIPARYMQFDTSAERLYSISQQTEQVLEELDQEVQLYLIAPKGSEDEKLTRLLKRYEDMSEHITVSYVDPVLSPAFVPQYTSIKLSSNSMLVVCNDRVRVIRNSELFPNNYDYDTGSISEDFDGEGQITSAIRAVTAAEDTTIYLIAGHGEDELSETLISSMEKEGLSVQGLNLVQAGEVPADAGALWMHVPVSDLTADETQMVESYLEKGGRLLLITGITSAEMPNLSGILEGYGLEQMQGMIVETDGERCIPGYQNFLLPKVWEHEVTQPLLEADSLLLLPNAHAIRESDDHRKTVLIEKVLETTSQSYLKTDTSNLSYQSGDAIGPFAVGMLASELGTEEETRIAWYSSSSMMQDDVDDMVGRNNTDLILNTIQWMTGTKQAITIRPKPTSTDSLRLTSSDMSRWAILFIAVIPLVFLVSGIIVCIRRSRMQ